MALIRWEPVRELGTIQNEMNRLLQHLLRHPDRRPGRAACAAGSGDGPGRDRGTTTCSAPTCPGLTEEDVNIELEDNVLTISGERKSEHEDAHGRLLPHRAQLRLVPPLADACPRASTPRRSRRSSTNGVLEVTVPKPEQRKPRKVAITRRLGRRLESPTSSRRGDGRRGRRERPAGRAARHASLGPRSAGPRAPSGSSDALSAGCRCARASSGRAGARRTARAGPAPTGIVARSWPVAVLIA